MPTIAHITHEAVQKIGGIGAVLKGMVTAASYQRQRWRTIFVGPLPPTGNDPRELLPAGATVWYWRDGGIDKKRAAARLSPIEQRLGVRILWGQRRYPRERGAVAAAVELLLIDVATMPDAVVKAIERRLSRAFGLRYDLYPPDHEFEQFNRLSQPACEALAALHPRRTDRCLLLSHEWFGVPTALWAIDQKDPRFRTAFHAHEVATVRPVVENHPGHDVRFYNAMALARRKRRYHDGVFGAARATFRYGLIRNVHRMDRLLAVGDPIVDELLFQGAQVKKARIDLAYNGIPSYPLKPSEREASREKLRTYAQRLLGAKPDFVFSHVARPVVSKAFWRDVQVLEALEKRFAATGETAVLFVLASARPARSSQQVQSMVRRYRWPLRHRSGPPDLQDTERDLWRTFERFNRKARSSRIVFVNQFGWSRAACGPPMPADMTFMDLRQGTDVEFGMSIYEPFGIAQLEPLSFGAICVISSVCGCAGFARRLNGPIEPNVIIADFTRLEPPPRSVQAALRIGRAQAAAAERRAAREIADRLFACLPRTAEQRAALLRQGRKLAAQMGWDVVCREYLVPALRRALARRA